MKVMITKTCYVAGKNRVVGEVVEGSRRDLMPAVGALRAEAAAEDAKVGKPAKARKAAGTGGE